MTQRSRRLTAVVLAIVVTLAGCRALVRARTFQLLGVVVARMDTQEPVVALTFDDGPNDTTIDDILKVLAESSVLATFFVIGSELEAHPEAGRRLVAAGHELGNHSYSHRRMVFTAPATARAELERTDALIRAAGQAGQVLFRPPYGLKCVGLPWYLTHSRRTSVTWDIEPESYSEVASSAPAIVEHVMERVRPGSIILLHPWYRSGEPTRQALPTLIQGIRERGFRFARISELLQVNTE